MVSIQKHIIVITWKTVYLLNKNIVQFQNNILFIIIKDKYML